MEGAQKEHEKLVVGTKKLLDDKKKICKEQRRM
jgi:hypothetical protein